MGRLIDADALFPNGVFLVDEKNPMKSITELINRIANAPTAYNVEKVVAELENSFFQVEQLVDDDGYKYKAVKVVELDMAIDIVKAGAG